MPDGTWTNVATNVGNYIGNWWSTGSWASSIVANGAGFTAYITSNINARQRIDFNSTATTIGTLYFSDGGVAGNERGLLGSYLTLDNLANKPVVYCITLGTVSGVNTLRGTNGFRVTGSGSRGFQLYVSQLISGEVELEKGYLVLGTTNSATPAVLPNVSGFNWVGNTYARLYYYGTTTAFTETRLFTYTGSGGSADNGASVCAQINNALVILNHSSVQTFPGQFTPATTDALTMCGFSFGTNFPAAAWEFLPQSAHTTNVTRTSRFDFAHTTPQTSSARVLLYSSNAVSGTVGALNDNATAATEFTGVARPANEYGTNSGAALALALGGTNTASTYSGNILHVAGSGTLSVQKDGAGTWALSGTNTYTGGTTVNAGTLKVASNGALGAGDISVTAGTLEFVNGVNVSNLGRTLTLASTGATAVKATSGNNSLAFGSGSLNSTGVVIDVAADASLSLVNSSAIAESGGSRGLSKTGSGTLYLSNVANTYTGTLQVAGKVIVGAAGAVGNGSVSLNGTLGYNGSTKTSSSTPINFATSLAALEGSTGSAPPVWSGSLTWGSGVPVKLTGTSTLSNELASNVANGATALTIQKTDSGTWLMTGLHSHTGSTVSVTAGTLEVYRPDGNTMSSTVTVSSGATMQLRTDANPALTNTGRVLGTSSVSVTGALRTGLAGVQRGRMRYGGNVTFNGGAVIYPGTV